MLLVLYIYIYIYIYERCLYVCALILAKPLVDFNETWHDDDRF